MPQKIINNNNNNNNNSNNINNNITVLVVDDEPDLCQLYHASLSRSGYKVLIAEGVKTAQDILNTHIDIACVVSDFRMGDGTGLDLVKYVAKHYANLPICLITAYSNSEQSVEALKEGAFDYLSKPVSVLNLRRVVAAMAAQNQATHIHIQSDTLLVDRIAQYLPGQSTAMKAIHHTLAQLVQTTACVVIQGEPGTGKELAARALHKCSLRSNQAFIVLNCSIFKDSTSAEAALFGCSDNNNGNNNYKTGAFQAAQGGTLLLDEVSCLPIDTQLRLLNTLQNKHINYQNIDTTENIATSISTLTIDVRVVISTTMGLAHWVSKGLLRQDLYYRLNVMSLIMPPLRDRAGDAPWLAQRWLDAHSNTDRQASSLSAGSLAWLRSHTFSGNIRELDNIIERGAALCLAQGSHIIEVTHLQQDAAIPAISAISAISAIENTHAHTHMNTAANTGVYIKTEFTTPFEHINQINQINQIAMSFPMDLMAHLNSIERKIIEQALQKTRYNRTQAAALLGLNIRQIRYRIEQLGIEC